MIPGKSDKPEDFLLIAWRRRWVILAPLVVCSLGMVAYVQTLANQYKSQETIMIVPPREPAADC